MLFIGIFELSRNGNVVCLYEYLTGLGIIVGMSG